MRAPREKDNALGLEDITKKKILRMTSTIHGTYRHTHQHDAYNPHVIAQHNKHEHGTREASMHNAQCIISPHA